MNRQLHRVVFNAARGMRIVVQETAKSTGKGAGRVTGSATVLIGLLAAGAAPAQIAGAPNVPGQLRPTVLTAPNGVPLINIQTPSGAGVSRNIYNQLNVGKNGAILNNSRVNVQTQLGGFVQGNPFLATGPARIILNEVNGGAPSRLHGYIEVGGQRAEVIVANPAGITVDGGGFINANRATLTTGTPQFNAMGGLDSFLVRGGAIAIDGAGLDASKTDYAAILARAVHVNAGIWASDLKVVAGASQVSVDSGQVTPAAGAGAVPTYALDVAALGGMYANRISLIGSEAGLGVRNAGNIGASAGHLVVTASGRLENIGTLEGQSVQLSVTAGDVDNRGGTIRQTSNASLDISVQTLTNTGGGVIGLEPAPARSASIAGTGANPGTDPNGASGAGPSSRGALGGAGTTASHATYAPPLPGSIAASGAVLNDGGKIYAGGQITLQSAYIDNNGGQLSVASMAVNQPMFDNRGGVLTVSSGFSANIQRFDNTGGKLNAGNLQIIATGDLINIDGVLTSGSDISLSVGGNADNMRGTVAASGASTASVKGTTNNSGGTLAANQRLMLDTGALDNTKGNIQSALAGVQVRAAGLMVNGAGGSVNAATDLGLNANRLENSGTLRSTNDASVTVGALVNDGGITAGRHTAVTAGSVRSGADSVLGAGIRSDGQVGGSGHLRVTATGPLIANGTNLAAGNATLEGASVDLSGKQTNADNIAITATLGSVTTSKALIVTPGTLSVTAAAQPAQTLVNDGGKLSAGRLELKAWNIANTNAGEIVQTGTGASTIATAGTLNNDGGRILSNGQDLSLRGATIASAGGKIEHAGTGTLNISGESYSGANGQVTANGALVIGMAGTFSQDGDKSGMSAKRITIDAASLSNRGGQIVQTGGDAMRITVVEAMDNSGGTMAGNGKANIEAGSLTNHGGTVRAAETSNLEMVVAGRLDNSNKGVIVAAGNTTLKAGSLDNDAGTVSAVGDLSATVAGTATNSAGGTLAANGNTTLLAGTLDNNAGTAVAVKGNLNVTTTRQTTNEAGTLQAGARTTVSAGGLVNKGGKIFGDSLSIEVGNNAVDNSGKGTLAATATVDVKSGLLNNDTGLIQSGGAMTIDTNGRALTNTNAAGYVTQQGGISSADTLTLKNVGAVNNAGGFIGARSALTATTQAFVNTLGGSVLGQSAVAINTGGAGYDNTGGQTQAVNGLSISAASLANGRGLIRSTGNTTLDAGSISNAGTRGASQGIEGNNVVIGTASLNNTEGAIRANIDARISSGGHVDNTRGLMSAAITLALVDPNAASPGAKTLKLANADGTLVADESLRLDAAAFSGDGRIVSAKNLSIALTQDIFNNGEVAANGSLSYTTAGSFRNNGKLLAGQALTVGGSDVDNAAGAEISGIDTVINASGTLTNRGLIDSKRKTQINAGVLKNIGTGRIYGHALSIGAGNVENYAETINGVIKAGTVAARDTLDIGADTIENREHALIFSGGLGANAMKIGASLDADRSAIGQGTVLNNLSADIESLGNMSISMAQVNNRDVHIQQGAPGVTNSVLVGAVPKTPVGSGTSTIYLPHLVRLDAANGMMYLLKKGGAEELIGIGGYSVWTTNLTTTSNSAGNVDPARLVAGGQMNVNGRLYNQDSQVLAGDAITATAYVAKQMTGQSSEVGLASAVTNRGVPEETNVPLIGAPKSIKLGAYKYQENINATSGYNAGAAPAGSASGTAGAVGGVNDGRGPGVLIEIAANVGEVVKTFSKTTGTADDSGATARASASHTVPMVVRTSAPNTRVPNASLFNLRGGIAGYLIETDPRFASYRAWLSSDYLLNNFGLDPNNILKRLGDGFYEQKLIREQVAQLTGYRYLEGFSNDDDQYAALMDAGATFARQYGLRPGIALSAAQMAQLTSDIVWLVEQAVTLPDGSTQRVLAPQVYVRVRPGDIDGSGALLSADAVTIKSGGDLVNTGTIAGRSLVSINAENVDNLGGRIAGGSIYIDARNDLNNIGGSITARDGAVLEAGRDINVRTTTQSAGGTTGIDRVAGVYVTNPGGTLIASAGRDANIVGAVLASAGEAAVGAGRNINLNTVSEGYAIASTRKNASGTASMSREVGSVVQAQDNVRLAAGNDINSRAGAVASMSGGLVVSAGNDINLSAGQTTTTVAVATQKSSKSLFKKSSSSTMDRSSTTDVLSSSFSGERVALVAGNDINLQAAQLHSVDAMSLLAGRDINLTTADRTNQELHAAQSKRSGTAFGQLAAAAHFAGDATAVAMAGNKNSSNHAEASITTTAIGTSISAGGLQTVSGRDTTLRAATVVADNDITMLAGRNLTIESAQNTRVESSYDANSKSGMVGEWYNPAIGNIKGSQASATASTTQQASQVASLQGNVTLVAGNEYRQTASSVLAAGQAGPLAGGDVNILAKNVVINEAFNTTQSVTMDKSSSTIVGGSASFMGVSTDTLKGASSTIKAMGETKDGRAQALGAINLAMSGKQVYDTASKLASGGGLSYGVSVNVSRNSSQSTSFTNSSEAVGSGIVGANNVNIVATGGDKASNIRAIGSTIAAGSTVNLAADNDVTLEASKNTSKTVGQNSSRGSSVGVTFGAGAQTGFSIQLGVSKGKGRDNQDDISYNATQVSGGKAVNISSGGDLNMRGGIVEANRVTADVGGNLNVETLQDVSVGQSRQSSGGFGLSLCIPPICYGVVATVSASSAGAKADGMFVSPAVQSGIKAGDEGFDVKVKGNTNLKGAVIESTQAAVDNKKNSFSTDGALTMSDLQNVSQSSGSSYSVSGSVGIGYTEAPKAATETAPANEMTSAWAGPNNRPGGSAGVGSFSGNDQASVTKSGISGIAGDQSVRTGDNSSAGTLVKDWNIQTIVKDVQAQAQITQEFGQNASKAVGDYANSKLKEANDLYDQAAAEVDPGKKAALYAQADQLDNNWKEGGAYRIAAHAAVGGLTGGAGGAAGAAASSIAIPAIGEQIANLDIPVPVKQALVMAMGAAIGATAGGTAGAAGGFNEASNNYLTATDLRSRQQKIEDCRARKNPACEVDILRAYDLKNAKNTGELKGSSLIEKMGLENVRAGLEQLLLDPEANVETKAQARRSLKEVNTAINLIDKAPVLKDAAEVGLLAIDIATLGSFAIARVLSTSIVKEFVLRRTGKAISDDAAERIAGIFLC
jgi:filamentous hemagglutinin